MLRTYFPGLNGLRAIAAITVVVLHINEFLPQLFKKEALFKGTNIAELSVVLFFVLSGFLITYLLLREKEETETIRLKNFYIKRILRIWPPYFLVLILSLLLFPLYKSIPGNPSSIKTPLLYYLLILPNAATVLSINFTPMRPLWSIGVEEQFYLVWPWFVRYIKKPLLAIFLFISGYILAVKFLHYFGYKIPYAYVMEWTLAFSPMHIMAFGALGAWLYIKQRLKIIYHPITQIAALLLWLTAYFFTLPIPHEVFAVAFLIIILNTATNPKPLLTFENRILDYLGRISYGIYVYHMLVIVLVLLFVPHWNRWVLSLAILIATIGVAALSFFVMEERLLRLRKRLK